MLNRSDEACFIFLHYWLYLIRSYLNLVYMNFKKLKRISPAQKIYACIAVIASFLIFTFIHFQILDTRLSESIARHDLSGKLLQQAQYLPFNAELILREVPKSKDFLEKNLNIYEKHFYTLKGGGLLYYDGVVSALTASGGESKEAFQELETVWFEFKANGEVLLNQETFIGGSEMATGIIDEFGNYIAEEVFKSVTPEVRMSIDFIEGNSQLFLELNTKIVELYENEVKVLLKAKRVAMYFDSTLLLLLVFILMYLFRSAYFQNIQRLRSFAEEVSSGNIDVQAQDKVGGELGRIWVAFESILGTFKNAVQFIERIGRGELNVQYDVKGDEDDFGKALIHMKERMIQTADEDKKRKIEDDIRSWTTHGIAKFGELLRQNNANIGELSYSVVSELIEYIDANQGGVFVLEEDYEGRYFSLVASYAYNRRKFLEKRIAWGDTLIGRCALEQKTLYLKEVPEDYLEISSGLGNYRPASLLLCPLKYNDGIYGVVELASFSELEPHHIAFVEKISESIASTISSVRINSKTSQLLEESKEQAERLSQQEEEMRQNMEEMQATQEEAAIRTNQLEGIINAIDNTLGTFELDLKGKYINANTNYLKTIKSDVDTLLIQNHRDVVAQFSDNLEGYDELMNTIINGGTVKRVFQYQLEQEMLYILESFTPVYDAYGNISKIIVFATNITENKQNELAVQNSLERVQEQELMLNENIEKIQEAQQLLEEKDERQRSEIAQLVSDNEAKVMMLKMREEINNAVINASESGILVFNKRGEVNIANERIRNILTVRGELPFSIYDIIGDIEEKSEKAFEEYKDSGKIVYCSVSGEEIPLHLKIVESKTETQSAYIGFVTDLRDRNKTEQEKDGMLSQALAREIGYKAKIAKMESLLANQSNENSGELNPTTLEDFKLEWNDSYSVGYASIDDQHKKLINIINGLYSAFKSGQGFIKLQKILNELTEYTKIHFSHEEELFDRHAYEHAYEHKILHRKLIDKINDFELSFKQGEIAVAPKLIEFLKDWLLNHILGTDKKYTGKLGDDFVFEQKKEGAQDRELKDIDISVHEVLVGIAEVDNALHDCIDFVRIVRKNYLQGADAGQIKALCKEFIDLFTTFILPVERIVEEGGYEYADAIKTEHKLIEESVQNILDSADGIDFLGRFIDELTGELVNYLSLGYLKFCEFVHSSSFSVEDKDNISHLEEPLGGETIKFIEWASHYEIGIVAIDDQHKILVDLLGQLYAAFAENRTRKQIKTLLKGATDYTEYHFGVEERNFIAFDYSEKTDHIAVHQLLVAEIKGIQSVYDNKDQGVDFERKILEFTSKLLKHFKEDDARFVELFRQNGID